MNTAFLGLSRYILIIFAAFYALHCFLIFSFSSERERSPFYFLQAIFLGLFHVSGFACLSMRMGSGNLLLLCALEEVFLLGTIILYKLLYPASSRLITNNLCFFLAVGFVILTRLSINKSVKQFLIAVLAMLVTLVIPHIIEEYGLFRRFTYHYGLIGILMLLSVLIKGTVTRGSRLSYTVAGVTFQPSELAKILFILALAGLLAAEGGAVPRKNRVIASTILGASYVLILVLSRDLGSALIFFVVFFSILYASLKNPLVLIGGAGAGTCAAVLSYKLFSHVRTRVTAWRDPFKVIEGQGYQITQSLFAIGTGGWFGMGLMMGSPDKIPIVEADFIFSAISEELGCVFSISVILIFLSTFLMFMNVALSCESQYYRLIALGITVCYSFQVFLAIGGVTKFIPMTGVTFPLMSYGGSSLFSTFIMFGIMQGIYLIRKSTG